MRPDTLSAGRLFAFAWRRLGWADGVGTRLTATHLDRFLQALPTEWHRVEEAVGEGRRDAFLLPFAPRASISFVPSREDDVHGRIFPYYEGTSALAR